MKCVNFKVVILYRNMYCIFDVMLNAVRIECVETCCVSYVIVIKWYYVVVVWGDVNKGML